MDGREKARFADEQVELAFSGLNLGDVELKEASLDKFALQIACSAVDGAAFKSLALRLVTHHIRQAAIMYAI
jgi:hypothetical protein